MKDNIDKIDLFLRSSEKLTRAIDKATGKTIAAIVRSQTIQNRIFCGYQKAVPRNPITCNSNNLK